MNANTDWNHKFSSSVERTSHFIATLLRKLPNDWCTTPRRILDLGCGVGDQTVRLAEAFPRATVVGLDISAANIEIASKMQESSSACDRLEFVQADYLEAKLKAFDLIVSDTCLHLIPTDDDGLFGKIATELNAHGILAYSMPFHCFHNRVLGWTRSLLRAVRGRWSDALIFHAAKTLHPKADDRFLHDRIHYMYRLPHRWGGARLNDHLRNAFHLNCFGEEAYPHASPGQAKHRFWIFRKD